MDQRRGWMLAGMAFASMVCAAPPDDFQRGRLAYQREHRQLVDALRDRDAARAPRM